ncbi:MAG: transcription antitermination factor NusB [bacterium]
MKTSSDPRHQERINKVQALFAYTYGTDPKDEILPILPHLDTIDAQIKVAAPEWPLSQVNRIDLAILRQATFELLHAKDTPAKVVIDEAIEIGKTYGGESTPSFVNGVLGTILKSISK